MREEARGSRGGECIMEHSGFGALKKKDSRRERYTFMPVGLILNI